MDPRRRTEPLERLVRVCEQWLGFMAAVLPDQPFAELELRDGEPENEVVLAEDVGRTAELALDLARIRGQPGPKPRCMRGEQRGTLARPQVVDRGEHALDPRRVAERRGTLELLDDGQLDDEETNT